MKTINVTVEKNPFQVHGAIGAINNFQVVEKDWDLGSPIGNGETLEAALEDFEASYECKFDEEVKAIIVAKVNY